MSNFADYVNGSEAFRQGWDDVRADAGDQTSYRLWARAAMDDARAAAVIAEYNAGRVAAGGTALPDEGVRVTVVCEDGQVRHDPFATLGEAKQWADWGHACTNRHTFKHDDGQEGSGQ